MVAYISCINGMGMKYKIYASQQDKTEFLERCRKENIDSGAWTRPVLNSVELIEPIN